MSAPSVLRRHFQRECLAAGLTSLTVVVALALGLGGGSVTRTISHVVLVGAPLFAAAAGVPATRRAHGRTRASWALLTAAAVVWAAGEAASAWQGASGGTPDNRFGHVGHLAAVLLALGSLVSLPSLREGVVDRVKAALDGLIIFGSLVFAAWVVVLNPAVEAERAMSTDLAWRLVFPLADCVLVALLACILLSRARRGLPRTPLLLIGSGLVSLAATDASVAYLTAVGDMHVGHVAEAGWMAAWLFIMLGARVPRPDRVVPRGDEAQPTSVLATLLPYAGILVAVVFGAAELVRTGTLPRELVGVGVLLLALGIGRQWLILVDTVRLTQDLEQRVATRTAEIKVREERFRSLVQHSSDVITVVDPDGILRYASASMTRVFGFRPDEVVGVPFTKLLHPYDLARFHELVGTATSQPAVPVVAVLTVSSSAGEWRTCEATFTSLLHDASVGGIVINTRDVTDQRELERRLEHEAFHDRLTGLANRALFADRLRRCLATRSRRPRPVALLLIDLDGFKAVNDELGAAFGDGLLAAFAERLRGTVRGEDTVARLGGDEFALVLEEMDEVVDAAAVAERLAEMLQSPFAVAGREIRLSATCGVAVADDDVVDADELLRNADLALHRAKTTDRGGWKMYESDMHAALMLRRGIEQDLRLAVSRNELVLHYQPLVELTTGRVLGTEALLRWNHPDRGLLAPMTFVPIAEETGLIVEIGQWVLDQACLQGAQWQRRFSDPGHAPLMMSVNLSGRQLQESELVRYVAMALNDSGLAPDSLMLEITESLLLEDDGRTMHMLRVLKAMGVKLAIDDFGTGYSSLSYLHRLPVDVLKVDKSFVELLARPRNEEGNQLARTVVQLGHSLGLNTVAEGIETQAELQALKQCGCEVGQGFYFAQPVPADQVERLLATHAAFGPEGPVQIRPA